MLEGIMIGVAASAVFTFLALFSKQWLIPRFHELTYDGTKLDGTWECYYEGSEEPDAEIDFYQKGRTVKGESHVTRNTRGERIDRRYLYSGRYLNTSVVLTFEDLDNPTVFGGSMVFYTCKSDGRAMKGIAMYYKPEVNDVVTARAELWKKGTRPKTA